MARPRRKINGFSVGRIGKHCLVTPTTVRRWIKAGKLQAIRLPSGHYRVSIADFRDFLRRYNMPVEGDPFESESEKEGGDK
ncbi:MAG: helix-turn-helix domain-containing protein [Dehalococcoidales bacterium]|nr:helix-turn-helix domain-containing protein [Dehalococcoidales bacterium]